MKLVNVVIFSPFMATVLSKHVKSITKIHLFRQTRDYPRDFPRHFSISEITLSDLKILSVISKCTNLTKLHLCNIYLNEDACEQIAKNCQAIRCLNLCKYQEGLHKEHSLMVIPYFLHCINYFLLYQGNFNFRKHVLEY